LQSAEGSLSVVDVDAELNQLGFDCTGVAVPEMGMTSTHKPGIGGGSGGNMAMTQSGQDSSAASASSGNDMMSGTANVGRSLQTSIGCAAVSIALGTMHSATAIV